MSKSTRSKVTNKEGQEEENQPDFDLMEILGELKGQLQDLREENRELRFRLKEVETHGLKTAAREVADGSGEAADAYEEEQRSVAENSSGIENLPVESTSFHLAQFLTASSVKAPSLRDFEKESIRHFMRAYEDYVLHVPPSMVRKPQCFLRSEFVEVVGLRGGKSTEELVQLDNESFFKLLCSLHKVSTMLELESKYKTIKMKKDDLQLSTFLAYCEDWKFEMMCAGDLIQLPAKKMAQLFVDGLKPPQWAQTVRINLPETFQKAKALALESLDQVRLVQTQAHLFQLKPRAEGAPSKPDSNGKAKSERSSDQKSESKSGGGNSKRTPTTNGPNDYPHIKCNKCHQMGHYANKCPNPAANLSQSSAGAPGKPPGKPATQKKAAAVESVPATQKKIEIWDTQGMDEAPPSADTLFRISAEIRHPDTEASERITASVFCDSGSNIDTINARMIEQLNQSTNPVQVHAGKAIALSLATNHQTTQLSGDWVEVAIILALGAYRLRTVRKLYVMSDTAEDIVFGLATLKELHLLAYMDKGTVEVLEDSEEEQYLNRYEESNRLFPLCAKMETEQLLPVLDINPSFPKLDELKAILAKHGPQLFAPFDSIGLRVTPMRVDLKVGAVAPTHSLRYINPQLLPRVRQEIDRLVEEGILIPTTTASNNSPLVIVPKPDGSIRLAVDYRELNRVLVPFSGTIPNMRSLFPYLQGQQFFACLDNLWGYHQLPIVPEHQDFTTIVTPWGQYAFTRCPFGLSTAPGVYQDRMAREVLSELVFTACVVFIDDTVVYGRTADEFLQNLDNVLTRMVARNVRLKAAKCVFGYGYVKFLGHIFDKDGYRLSEERKQAIMNVTAPQTLKQLRSFLGMVNYFRDFIPQLSTLLVPLTQLTSKRGLEWSEEAEAAFQATKLAVLEASSLYHLEPEGRIVLYTDASVLGMGATLVQENAEGVARPIMFLSKKFSAAAQKWSTIEQECFAVFYAITQLQSHLLGRHFFVATDHRNLIYLQRSTIPKLVRWRLRLLEYDFTILHVPGKDNVVADALSRMLRMVTVKDKQIDSATFLDSIHNKTMGHHGIMRTITMAIKAIPDIKQQWPSFRKDIEEYVRTCPVCQKVKYQATPVVETESYHLSGSYPMANLSIDTVGPLPLDDQQNQYILVIICDFSKFATLYATPSTEAVSYVNALVQHIGLFGVPSTIRTDGGSQFTAHIAQQVSTLLGFQHTVILPYHPQANGIVERHNAEVMKHLRAMVLEGTRVKQWSLALPLVQRILNATHNSSIGTYPARILFGDALPIQGPLLCTARDSTLPTPLHDYLKTLLHHITTIVINSQDFLANRQQLTDARRQELRLQQPHEFKVGDYVLVSYSTRAPHKLAAVYRGPLKIVEKTRDDIYQCLDLVSNQVLTFHVDRLRIFHTRAVTPASQYAQLALADSDMYIVEYIVAHRGRGNTSKTTSMEYLVRWLGYPPEEDTWLKYAEVRQLDVFQDYLRAHPELKP